MACKLPMLIASPLARGSLQVCKTSSGWNSHLLTPGGEQVMYRFSMRVSINYFGIMEKKMEATRIIGAI